MKLLPLLSLLSALWGLLAYLAAKAKAQGITISRDVVIIGGGATGTYAAVRLQQDMGKSVVVIEQTDRLVSIPRRQFPALPAVLAR